MQRNFCVFMLVFFNGFGKEIFYNKTKVHNTKNCLSAPTDPDKLIVDRKCFPTPFLPLLAKIRGRTATKITQ